jgi:hypothetical protein
MNTEKMSAVICLFNELVKENGVYGFNFHANEFHVGIERLINEPNLQIENRDSVDYPYEIFVQFDGFKVFAILTEEQVKEYPQFKDFLKTDLKRKLAYLEEDVDLTGGEEIA